MHRSWWLPLGVGTVLSLVLIAPIVRSQEAEKKKPSAAATTPAKPAAKEVPGKQSAAKEAPAKEAAPKDPAAKEAPGKPAAVSPDEQAIRDAAKAFADDFNRGDAAAVAAHWTADGEYVDEEGAQFVGREAIQQEYQSFFAENRGAKMTIVVDAVRLLSTDTAIEDGHATLELPAPAPALGVTGSRYTAVHVRQKGRWLMASVRDTAVEPEVAPSQLTQLEPLVGTWSATFKNRRLETTVRWIVDKSFLERTHTLTEDGKSVSSGVEIIGIDPTTGQISSWSFAAGGGYATGLWTPRGDGWVIEVEGFLPDGTPTNALHALRKIDENTLGWRSEGRMAGETYLPDLAEVQLKRGTAK